MRKCPRCGQKTSDQLLAQCPYCRVALVSDTAESIAGLTPEQVRTVAWHIFGSWKLWLAAILLIAAAAWGVVQVSQKVIDARSQAYLSTLEINATNRIAIASQQVSQQISQQVSNQIESEFKQPRIQTAIEQVAKDRVNDVLTNSMWPSLEAFQQSLKWANSQLANSTNALAKLNKDLKTTQEKLAKVQIPKPPPAVAATRPAAPATPPLTVPTTTPTPPGGTTKLSFASQAVAPNGADYVLTIFFKPTSADSIGPVSLIAGTFRQTAKVVNFALVTPGHSEPMVLNDVGDAAQLKFNVAGGDAPAVALEVTGPTIVRVTGDALAEELTLPVAAEKMAVPSAAR